jgi:hypothetical protein
MEDSLISVNLIVLLTTRGKNIRQNLDFDTQIYYKREERTYEYTPFVSTQSIENQLDIQVSP